MLPRDGPCVHLTRCLRTLRVIQLAVRSFDAARDGPCAHGKLRAAAKLCYGPLFLSRAKRAPPKAAKKGPTFMVISPKSKGRKICLPIK